MPWWPLMKRHRVAAVPPTSRECSNVPWSMDAVGVDPAWRRRHVGKALLRQLRLNLGALRITSLRTEVSWDDFDLLAFLRNEGFPPAERLCLERPLDPTEPGD